MTDDNGFVIQVPSNKDLEEVHKLIEYRDSLIEQLAQTNDRIVEMWKKIPYDPDLMKKPHQSDIATRCRNCGRPTKWVSPKGYSSHYILREGTLVQECPPDKLGRSTPGIDPSIWAILDMPDEDIQNLDDDEIVELIQGRPLSKKDGKPSEREN